MRAPSEWLDALSHHQLVAATALALLAAVLLIAPAYPGSTLFEWGQVAALQDSSIIHGDADPADPPPPESAALVSFDLAFDLRTAQPPAEPAPRQRGPLTPRVSAELPILMYHHVGHLPERPDATRRDLTVSPASFENQLKYLAEIGAKTVDLGHLMDHLDGREELPPRAVALTFDDGYADNYDYAFPLLQKHDMIGTFFITTDFVGRPGYMTWPQLQEMAGAGMSIQAHSANHADLTALPPPQLTRQLVEPKRLLEERLGRPVRFLAYPAGKHNRAVIVATHRAGYEAAVTVNHGTLQIAEGPYELRRVRARGGDSVEQLAARLTPPGWGALARR